MSVGESRLNRPWASDVSFSNDIGFGGGCLPKDMRAFMARAGGLGADQALTFLREVQNFICDAGRGWSSWPVRLVGLCLVLGLPVMP